MAKRHRSSVEPDDAGDRRHLDRRRGAAPRGGERLPTEDVLTGLITRTGFDEAVSAALVDGPVWVALVDLDRFAAVNDSFGHAGGDAVLVEVARRIDEAGRHLAAIVARFEADEFAIAVPAASEHEVDLLVATVMDRLRRIDVSGHPIELGCSIGLTQGAAPGGVAELVGEADLAVFRAKRSGRGRAVRFDHATRHALALFRERTIGAAVEVAVRLQRSLHDRSIVGALVLARVPATDGDPLEGADLRLVAEFAGRRFGLLDATLEGIGRSGRTIPPAGLRLWFEVSATDLVTHGGAEALWQRLSTVGLSGSPVGVELIDAGVPDQDALVAAVDSIRARGVHVAVGATGAGAVGLSALARLRPDRIVIDPSVIDAVRAGDPAFQHAVAALTAMGASLGAEAIAVGVASLDVAHVLEEMGVAVAQVVVTEPWSPMAPVRRGGPVVV